ncbi:MAG TPA: right-handed parallel beta-helix repeat-containing protein [Armatimonadota bacterium]|jgi:hypothetical protein
MRIAVTCFLLASLASARSAVVYVKDSGGAAHDGTSWATAFAGIQDGLDAARPGDEVWVAGHAPGVNLVFRTSNVALYGGFSGGETSRPQPRGNRSILTPATSDPVVTILASATGAVLDGFDISRGAGPAGGGVVCRATNVTLSNNAIHQCGAMGAAGGGILCEAGSSATIWGNVIESCAAENGGGILGASAALVIAGNTIRNNDAVAGADGRAVYSNLSRGGGVAIMGGSATITDNAISGNAARSGGGIWADAADLIVVRNQILDNVAFRESIPSVAMVVTASGGGVGVSYGTATLKDNVFARNRVVGDALVSIGGTADVRGGGLSCAGIGGVVANNTFLGNSASAAGAAYGSSGTVCAGGGAYLSGTIDVANNIFTANSATTMPDGGGADGGCTAPTYPLQGRQTHNLFFANSPDRTAPTGVGDVLADPLLPALAPYIPPIGSPAVDAGEISFAAEGDTDAAGSQRVQGRRVDIGAYEVPKPPGPARVFVSPEGSDAADGLSWATAKASIPAALNAIGLDGDVWVREGAYAGGFGIPSRVALYGGFRGDETGLEQHDFRARPTVIDAAGAPVAVDIPTYVTSVRLDGFTVRNAGGSQYFAGYGAGIHSAGRNVTIVNNTVTDNGVSATGSNPGATCAGILVDGGSATIAGNVIQDNWASASRSGPPQFASMVGALGAGVYVSGAQATVVNNLVTRNSVATYGVASIVFESGGGIVAQAASGVIANNTIVDNASQAFGRVKSFERGIELSGDCSGLTLANNIVAFNGNGVVWSGVAADPKPTLSHNDLFGNATAAYSGIDAGATDTAADPLFLDRPGGDYRLAPGSPCIDAGDDAFAPSEPLDLLGSPRRFGLHIDIGAYETGPVGPHRVLDAARILRIAAGLASPAAGEFARLDLVRGDGLNAADAARAARKAFGLDPNP